VESGTTGRRIIDPIDSCVWYTPRVTINSSSLERLVPDRVESGAITGQETLRLHVERYEFAASQLKHGSLLDCACGVGYGTRILIDRSSPEVVATGIDISADAVAYARERYATDRIEYLAVDAMEFSPDHRFDSIVSIETIEHLPDPAAFLDHVLPMLAPGGVFIGSVPVTPTVDVNAHHLHDFTERSFRRLFRERGYVEIASLSQRQPVALGALWTRSEARLEEIRPRLPLYYLTHPGALAKRLVSTLVDGFNVKYLTVAWRAATR
jgi:SAM-dependent methyltransferase